MFHNQIEDDDERLCGAHAWSEDGAAWSFGGTAWSNRVPMLAEAAPSGNGTGIAATEHAATGGRRGGMAATSGNGTAAATELYRFSRRERPHLLFDAGGAIVALTTGVQFGAHAPTSFAGEDACYTLLQPVRRAAAAAEE